MKTLKFALPVLALMTTAAFAEGLDQDGNGLVTFDEVVAMYPDVTEDTFAQADADENGSLDEAELATAVEDGLIPAE